MTMKEANPLILYAVTNKRWKKKVFHVFFFVKVFFVMNSNYCLFVHAIQVVFWGKLIITSINIEILRTNKQGVLQIPCKRCFRKKLIWQQQAKWVSFFWRQCKQIKKKQIFCHFLEKKVLIMAKKYVISYLQISYHSFL